MGSRELEDIIRQVDELTPEEQQRVVAHLAENARRRYQATKPRRQWDEICGAAPYPLVGEDAQQWVSHSRRESDKKRGEQRSKGQ